MLTKWVNMAELTDLQQAITVLEAQRGVLGDAVVDASVNALRRQLAEMDASPPDEQRRLVTVLFADLAGFTTLSERMDPEDVRELQDAFFAAMTRPIEAYEGCVEKYIGDAVLAVFGVPQAHEDDPERAVRAALALQEAMAALNERLSTVPSRAGLPGSVSLFSLPLPSLSLRVGVHTGLVISRVEEEGGFVVTGDTVNLAARLQGAAEPGTVLISGDTYRLVAHAFVTTDLGAIPIKGKAEPVQVYRVAGQSPVPMKLRGVAGLDSPLVGRQAEMAALRAALECLERGVGGIVTVVGEAGIGKSRLVAELRKSQQSTDYRSLQSASLPDFAITVHWVEGRCLSFGANIPYLLWVDLLRTTLGATLDDTPEQVRDRLREWVLGLCPERYDAIFPYLARLMSLPLEATNLADIAELDGQTLKQRTFRAAELALACVANRHPLVLVCEDLHWADSSSLELLQHLFALTNHASVLLICVFRPHADHGSWKLHEIAGRNYRHRHTDLALEPLSAADSEALVDNLLHIDTLPQDLRGRILSRTEGNPFFVEEVIRTLIDLQAIVHDEASGRWLAARDLADIPIPETLQGVIMARIDRLQADVRHVLQLAAVIGRIFPHRVLASISEGEDHLDEKLLDLQRQELIRERARIPELEYIFKHELTREAAYNGILKRQRPVLHCQVAETLERLFPDRLDEMAGLLAHHWEHAGKPQIAVEYLLKAGDQAHFTYALRETIDFNQRALALLAESPDIDQRAHVLAKLGMIYQVSGDYEKSHTFFDRSFVLWRQAAKESRLDRKSLPPASHPLRFPANEPERLCPITVRHGHTWRVLCHLFRGLNRLSPIRESITLPDVARAWEASADGRHYLFRLREDVLWSDGTKVSAGDFEFAWRLKFDPASANTMAPSLDFVRGAQAFRRAQALDPASIGIHALDDFTLSVELETRLSYFPKLVTDLPTYPVPRHAIDRYGEAWTEPENLVTNGPFRLLDWQRGKSMTVALDPNYDLPIYGNVRQVQMTFIRDAATELAMYEADLFDAVEVSGFSMEELDEILRHHRTEYFSADSFTVSCLTFNLASAPFDNSKVRRAFAHAIDIENLGNTILHGYESPAVGGLFPPGFPGHSPGIVLPNDPARAQSLLAEAGYPAGQGFPSIELLASGGSGTPELARRSGFHAAIIEYLARQWKTVLKVDVNMQILPFAAFRERLRLGTPDIRLSSWGADYPEPDEFLNLISAYSSWKDLEFDQLIATAREEPEQDRRIALYHAAHKLILEKAAIVPLVYTKGHWLVKPWFAYSFGGRYWQDFILEPH